MTEQAPKGTFHGTLRWYVHRVHARPARLGERHGPLAWAVSSIVQGRGSRGFPIGAPTICGTRTRALAFAYKQARRTYKKPENRP